MVFWFQTCCLQKFAGNCVVEDVVDIVVVVLLISEKCKYNSFWVHAYVKCTYV